MVRNCIPCAEEDEVNLLSVDRRQSIPDKKKRIQDDRILSRLLFSVNFAIYCCQTTGFTNSESMDDIKFLCLSMIIVYMLVSVYAGLK